MDDDLGTEAELAHVRRRARDIRRRAWIAKASAIGLTLLGLALGLVVEMAGIDGALWTGLIGGGLVGRIAWMKLEPDEDIDDL